MSMSHHVLVVEDDDKIAAPLIRTLEREGYTAERFRQGLPALDRLRGGDVDLVLLDLGLPDVDGLEVCRQVRADGFEGGIIILTARDGELDRVVGLDIGADDYLAKPFALAELLARARALLRRSTASAPSPSGSHPAGQPAVDGVRVDEQARQAWVDGAELSLTAREFDVLSLLASAPGVVLTRERLMNEVWDESWYGSTKTIDATVGRLRQKLDEQGAPVRIVTVRGVGFRMEGDVPDA